MANYQIIKDVIAFRNFVDFLPLLEEGECYYVTLFARKKYHASALNDKSSCKRFVATSKDRLVQKVRQLEIEKGLYKNKNGDPIDEDALALYININPRSFKRAQRDLLITLAGKVVDPQNLQNINSLSMSTLQKAKSRTCYVDFDFDIALPFSSLKSKIDEGINEEAYEVIVTRGGFHLLVDPVKVSDEFKKTWHRYLSTSGFCDVVGDNLVPFVGCRQGDTTPKLFY